jgi:rubrerythrin
MSSLNEMLEKQRKVELSHAEKLRPAIKKAKHRMVSALLESILYDSLKHAAFYQAMIDVEAGSIPVKLDMDMGDAVGLHQDIKQHVRVEEEMIKWIEKIMATMKEDRMKAILSYLLADEYRHHASLKELSNLLDRDSASIDEYLGLFQKYMIVPPS